MWILSPLMQRLRNGEGGLAVLAYFELARSGMWVQQPPLNIVSLLLFPTVLMYTLYLFNDTVDGAIDLQNPAKDQALAQQFVQHKQKLFVLHAILFAACLGLALQSTILSWPATVAVLVINVAYSLYFKGTLVADLIVVGLWGAAFVATVTSNSTILLAVGSMTALAHAFQISRDAPSDTQAEIRTSAVAAPRLVPLAVLVSGVLLAGSLAQFEPWLALTGAACAAVFFWRRDTTGWHISRAIFLGSWLITLWTSSAGGKL